VANLASTPSVLVVVDPAVPSPAQHLQQGQRRERLPSATGSRAAVLSLRRCPGGQIASRERAILCILRSGLVWCLELGRWHGSRDSWDETRTGSACWELTTSRANRPKRYGYVKPRHFRMRPDAFVESIATRIASFDKASDRRNQTLRRRGQFAPDSKSRRVGRVRCVDHAAAGQERIQRLLEQGSTNPAM